MAGNPAPPLVGARLLVARIALTLWGIVFAGTAVIFGIFFILYFSGSTVLGPCAPMGFFGALFALVFTGGSWFPAYLEYKRSRRPHPGPVTAS